MKGMVNMKKFKNLFVGLLVLVALIGFSVVVYASNNTIRTLNSQSTGDVVIANAVHQVSSTAPYNVNGIRVRALVSTGDATNWIEEVRTTNLTSNFRISTRNVISTHAHASATGQFQYRRQSNNSFQPMTVISRGH